MNLHGQSVTSDRLAAEFLLISKADFRNAKQNAEPVRRYFRDDRPWAEERDWLLLTYDFTISLEDARRWLIPSVGDDILCVVEDCQLSFPKE